MLYKQYIKSLNKILLIFGLLFISCGKTIDYNYCADNVGAKLCVLNFSDDDLILQVDGNEQLIGKTDCDYEELKIFVDSYGMGNPKVYYSFETKDFSFFPFSQKDFVFMNMNEIEKTSIKNDDKILFQSVVKKNLSESFFINYRNIPLGADAQMQNWEEGKLCLSKDDNSKMKILVHWKAETLSLSEPKYFLIYE